MHLDDELCLCFHVTRRKLIQFVRVQRPTVASQLSRMFWGRHRLRLVPPYLKQIFERECSQKRDKPVDAGSSAITQISVGMTNNDQSLLDEIDADLPSAAQYAQSRADYVRPSGARVTSVAEIPKPVWLGVFSIWNDRH